jgi:Xaa-Pro aminopeptidase
MHQEQRDRTHELLQKRGVDRALFSHPAHVTWLTGVAQPWRPGSDLYAGGPSLLWYESGSYTLIMMDGHAGEAGEFDNQPDCELIMYQGYSYEKQPAGVAHLAAALKKVVGNSQTGLMGSIGIETQKLPVSLKQILLDSQPANTSVTAIDHWLQPLRVTRTAEELTKMRENFALIGVAQAACDAAVKPGNLELDVWHAIHVALQNEAQLTLPLGNDCTVGRRGGGPALAVEILPTDSFVVDLSTIWKGYWSDSCVTYYATEPSAKQVKMHHATAEALDLAISLAKPGAKCRDIDQTVRAFLTDQGFPTYPHHTGHGISMIGHEAPRVTPHSEEILQAGMVVMLEPGIYYPGETGVRLEHAVLVTESGPEILTTYDLNIP